MFYYTRQKVRINSFAAPNNAKALDPYWLRLRFGTWLHQGTSWSNNESKLVVPVQFQKDYLKCRPLMRSRTTLLKYNHICLGLVG